MVAHHRELLETFLKSPRTLRNQDRDFPDWHKGRLWYYVWAVMIDDPVWQRLVEYATERLSAYLVDQYARQPHVTILPAGFVDQRDIVPASVMDICETIAPFELSPGSLGSFTGSPCYPVINPGHQLHALRTALRAVAVDPDSQVVDEHYLPHLTVGLYDDSYDTQEVAQQIRRVAKPVSSPINVDAIHLLRYQCSSIKGPLETVAVFKMGARASQIVCSTPFTEDNDAL